jgi:NADPH-dependent 7-cyano-7-deazaguanine reductase QueF
MTVVGQFTPRGGISSRITARYAAAAGPAARTTARID